MSAWYRSGTIAVAGKTVTGTGTSWTDNKMGIGPGQALLIPGAGTIKVYEIARVNSATQLTLTDDAGTVSAGQAYAIMSFYSDSVPDFARRLAAQLSYYQSQMDGWQKVMTGTGTITLEAPDGSLVTLSSFKKLTDDMAGKVSKGGDTMIGPLSLPSMELIGATPFIDFHLGSTTADYDVRVINDASNQLTISGSSGTASIRLDGVFRSYNNYVTRAISTTQAQQGGGFLDHAGSRTRWLNQPLASSGGFDMIALNANGTAKCTWNFNVDGGIAGPQGGVVWQGSDQALKHSIEDIEGGEEEALKRLLRIRPREFEWNNNGKRDRGFIAQEMLAIDERYANYSYRFYDENNDANDLSGEKEGVFGLSDRAIMADAIAVIQMQQKTIESMSGEIAELQARMKAIDGLDA